MKDPRILAVTAIGVLLALAFLARIEPSAATAALAPIASTATCRAAAQWPPLPASLRRKDVTGQSAHVCGRQVQVVEVAVKDTEHT